MAGWRAHDTMARPRAGWPPCSPTAVAWPSSCTSQHAPHIHTSRLQPSISLPCPIALLHFALCVCMLQKCVAAIHPCLHRDLCPARCRYLVPFCRMAEGENSTSTTIVSESGDASGHEAVHAMEFIFVSILAGCCMSLVTARYPRCIPYSSLMLFVGMLLAIFDHHVLGPNVWTGLHESLRSWESLDGHFILSLFLPPLLFADAISVDWHVARHSLGQCLLLAGPGVVMGSLLTAVEAMYFLPSDLTFTLALSFGAVLSATDPVAVVALLKGVGAPASITMIIAGESMLNDGTAIVLWRYFFDVHLGEHEFTASSLAIFLLRVAGGGAVLGLVSGAVLMLSLLSTSRRLEHVNVTLQTVVTLVGSYATFYIAESTSLRVSGTLAVVVQGLFLSATAWPLLVNQEATMEVWHTVEWVLLSLLFVLTGLITGDMLYLVEDCSGTPSHERNALCLDDLPWVVVTYLCVLTIRLVVVFALLPLLRRLGYGMTVRAALFASWGGLRGAVGLSLALSMHAEMEESRAGKLVILHVAGVALLTMLINATTSAGILRLLNMNAVSSIKRQLLCDIQQHVRSVAWAEFRQLRAQREWQLSPAAQAKVVQHVSFLRGAADLDIGELPRSLVMPDMGSESPLADGQRSPAHTRHAPPSSIALSPELTASALVDQRAGSSRFFAARAVARLRTRASAAHGERLIFLRQTFLQMLRSAYTEMVGTGVLPTGLRMPYKLPTTVDVAMDHLDLPIFDWEIVLRSALHVPWHAHLWQRLRDRCATRLCTAWRVRRIALQGPHPEVQAVYLLRCFILGHEQVQHELLDTLPPQDAAAEQREIVQVVEESRAAVKEARHYLRSLCPSRSEEGTPGDDAELGLMEAICARQLVALILSKIEAYVGHLTSHGILSARDADCLVLRQLAHDEHELSVHGLTPFMTSSGLASPRATPANDKLQALVLARREALLRLGVLRTSMQTSHRTRLPWHRRRSAVQKDVLAHPEKRRSVVSELGEATTLHG